MIAPDISTLNINGSKVELQLFWSSENNKCARFGEAKRLAALVQKSINRLYKSIGYSESTSEIYPVILKFIDASDGILIIKYSNDDSKEMHVDIDDCGEYENHEVISP